jgi:DNA-binding winged helix-turn-helix (wHTH) protein
MPEDHEPPRRFRFGSFELDVRSGELRKQGRRIRLQDQPLQVLTMLLEHSGEVVTREELQKRLWPADTFVDFDHGLNKAINKIREALADSAGSPRFVETVPRRGYRFLADVTADDAVPVRTAEFAGHAHPDTGAANGPDVVG